MESEKLELEKLIDCIYEHIYDSKLDGSTIPDLDVCSQELRILVENYVAVTMKKEKSFII